jgi:hypothetical protein
MIEVLASKSHVDGYAGVSGDIVLSISFEPDSARWGNFRWGEARWGT